jgi:hypothetical protein
VIGAEKERFFWPWVTIWVPLSVQVEKMPVLIVPAMAVIIDPPLSHYHISVDFPISVPFKLGILSPLTALLDGEGITREELARHGLVIESVSLKVGRVVPVIVIRVHIFGPMGPRRDGRLLVDPAGNEKRVAGTPGRGPGRGRTPRQWKQSLDTCVVRVAAYTASIIYGVRTLKIFSISPIL